MMTPPERSLPRNEAIDAVLPFVASLGWTRAALRAAGGPDAELLFPGGGPDMVEAYIDLADRRMVEAAAPVLAELRLTRRVRTLLEVRFQQAEPHKDAVRRAAALLANPAHALLAARCTARTVDAIWFAAGDTSADFSWYTKRALLGAVYSTTLFYWMSDAATQDSTMAFLDRRLAGIGRITKLRMRLTGQKAA